MIDISPYIERLNWLKEWIGDQVDRNITNEQSLELFKLTGVFILPLNRGRTTFEQYCEYKKSITINTTN